jgi:hypothetical protein
MNLTQIFQGLRNSITRYPKEYAEGRARQDALAPYPTARDALAALADDSPLGRDERGQLVLALVTEQQQAGHQLWQAMLLVAFERMIRNLRRRLGRDKDEDRDQDVLVAFLEAIKRLPPAERMPYPMLALRRATARRVYAARRPTQEEPKTKPFDEETHPCDPFTRATPAGVVEASAEEAARVMREGGGADELRDVVLATFAGESTLKEYVCRTYGAADDRTRAAAYERLCSARRRLRGRLRARQAPQHAPA